MIKLIIFDLDGVLVDAREIHYNSLNEALKVIDKKYVIQRQEHLSTYDGLSTTKKLNILTKKKELPLHLHDKIWKLKQEKTYQIIDKFNTDERICNILEKFKKEGYVIACATNSIRDTAKLQLIRRGFFDYIDFLYTNQDVNKPKPSSEIYLKCMLRANVDPHETIIIEDSHYGRKAALNSGGYLCPVKNSSEVTYERIKTMINDIEKKSTNKPKWQGGRMNVLIPMAGLGSRFKKAGYTFPKPLIEVKNKPMIQLVVDNLNIDARHIFVVQKEHYEEYNLKYLLNIISPDCEIIQVDGLTEGAACTTLLAKNLIDNEDPLVFANSDQFLDWDSNEFMYAMESENIDGGMLTFTATHPKWSFAKIDNNGLVAEVAEKKPISDIATAGIYYWKHGSDYVKYAEQMIEKDIRFNKEFYVCPVFNEAIKDNKKIKTFHFDGMWGIGTPEDLNNFNNNYEDKD
jgi:HAD superfamily hydrolase (TIGR01509 family)